MQIFFVTETRDAAYIRHSLRSIFRPLSSPRVTTARHDGWPSPLVISLCSARANLQFLLATFSIRLFTSPALTHVYIPLLLAQSISPFDFKNLKRISNDKVSPFMLLIRDTLRCLRYEKEPRSSPSPWYRRQGYYALVSTFRPTPRQQNIPRLFHLLRLFILTHIHTTLI